VVGSLTGTQIATSGSTGSVTLQATPNTTYLLVDTSAGGTPTSVNILSTVTMQQGTCPNGVGVPPPTTDLAQSVSDWQLQFLNNGSPGAGGASNLTDPQYVLDGTSSMFVQVTSGNAVLLTRNAPSTGWDFSRISTIQFSMQSDVPPGSWAAASPVIKLNSANGSLTLASASPSAANASYSGWLALTAPIAGSSSWTATTSGQFNVQDVTAIQVGFTVSGVPNFAVILNGMFLK
jgi:hypothetical protein